MNEKPENWDGPGPDGARGYTAEQGMHAVLGGQNIDNINKGVGAMTPQQMRKYIEEAPAEKNLSYSDEARRYAKHLLQWADQHKDEFLKGKIPVEIRYPGGFDLTGFQGGWGVNAVRYVLEAEHSIENPAIVSVPLKPKDGEEKHA